MKNKVNQSKILLILSMIIYGSVGIFRKYTDVSSSELAFARGVLGTLTILLVMLVTAKKPNKAAIKSNLIKLLISGALIGINWMLLFESYNYTTVSVATLCYYMAPVFLMLMAPIFLKEKLTLRKIICIVVALLGIVLVSGIRPGETIGANSLPGIIFGLLAALCYAIVLMINQKIKDIGSFDKTFVQLLAASVILIPYILVKGDRTLMSVGFASKEFWMVVIMGVLHTGVAYTLFFGAMKYLKAQSVAILSYLDPICALILSALILKERMDIYSIIGAVMILGAAVLSEYIGSETT